MIRSFSLAAVCSLMFPVQALAGGPLIIEGTNFVNYSPAVVELNLDLGDLDDRNNYDNDKVDSLVQEAIALWNDVPTSSLSLTSSIDLPQNVTGLNYTAYLPNEVTLDHPSFSDSLNPVVYDQTGDIVAAIYGEQNRANIAGIAISAWNPLNKRFTEGFALLNGATQSALTDDFTVNLIAHEVGHMIGLDHSQTDIDNTETLVFGGTICSTAPQSEYPVMYPNLCRSSRSLHPDDVSAISALYPSVDIDTTYGQLNGFFKQTNEVPIRGANIYAENLTSGDVVSIVSDYLTENNGRFSMRLLPGNYRLYANGVNPYFIEGSGVGPYSTSATDLSFQAPNDGIGLVTYEGNTGAPKTITIAAGTSVSVDFYLDGTGNDNGGGSTSNPGASTGGATGLTGSGMIAAPTILILVLLTLLGRRTRIH